MSEPLAQSCIRDAQGRTRVEVAPNLIETARAEVFRGGDLQCATERVLEGSSCDPECLDELLDREPVSPVVFDEPKRGRREVEPGDGSNARDSAHQQSAPRQMERAMPQRGGPGGRAAVAGRMMQASRELLEGADESGSQGHDAALRGQRGRMDRVRQNTGLVEELLRGGDLDGAEARPQGRALVTPRREDEEGSGGHLEPAPPHRLEAEREAEKARLHRRGVRDAAIHLEAGKPEVLEPELVPAKAKGSRVQLDGIRIPSV